MVRRRKRHALNYDGRIEGSGEKVMEGSGGNDIRPKSCRKKRGHRELGVGDKAGRR